MAEAQQDQPVQLDDGLAHLQGFVADLGARHEELGGLGDRLGQLQASLDALHDHLDAAHGRLTQLADDREHQVEGVLGDVDGAVASLLEEGQATGRTLTDTLAPAIDGHHEQITARVDEHGDRLAAATQQLHDQGLAVVDQTAQTASEQITDLRAQADATHDELTAKADELTTTVQTTGDATAATLETAGEQTQGDLLELTATGFGSFDQVTQQLIGDDGLMGAFAGFGGEAEAGFGQLGDAVAGLGDQLVEQTDALLTDTAQVVGQEVVQRIQEEFEKVVVGSVEALITDFVDSIGMMALGSSITAAISPFVPELAAAKAVVQTIDDLLDSLMLG